MPIRRGRWPGRSANGPRSAIRRSGRRRCWPTPWSRAASGSGGESSASDGVHRHDGLGQAGNRHPRRVRGPAGALAAGRAGPAARAGVTSAHASGHNLFGVASAAACLALGTGQGLYAQGDLLPVPTLGPPGGGGGQRRRRSWSRQHLFHHLRRRTAWILSQRRTPWRRLQPGRGRAKFRFHGTSAHAAVSERPARSSLDAVEPTNDAAELLRRSRRRTDTRGRRSTTSSWGAAKGRLNVVLDFAEAAVSHSGPRGRNREEPGCLAGQVASRPRAGDRGTRLEMHNLGGIVEIVPDGVHRPGPPQGNLERLGTTWATTSTTRKFAAETPQDDGWWYPPAPAALEEPVEGLADPSGNVVHGVDRRGRLLGGSCSTAGFTHGSAGCLATPRTRGRRPVAARGTMIGRQGNHPGGPYPGCSRRSTLGFLDA